MRGLHEYFPRDGTMDNTNENRLNNFFLKNLNDLHGLKN